MSGSDYRSDGMLHVEWSWDRQAKAATLRFGENPLDKHAETLEVCDRNGETVALVDFSGDGELLNLELLNAEKQIPRGCRG